MFGQFFPKNRSRKGSSPLQLSPLFTPSILETTQSLVTSQTNIKISNDIADIFNNDVWKIVLGYAEDSINYIKNYSFNEDGDIQVDGMREILIKDPFFTWTDDPSLFKLFIVSPRIAMQILQQDERRGILPLSSTGWLKKFQKTPKNQIKPEDTLAYLARCYAMKGYMNAILDRLDYKNKPSFSRHKIESQLRKIRNRKCNALTLGVCLGLFALSVYLINNRNSGNTAEQISKIMFGLALLAFVGAMFIIQSCLCLGCAESKDTPLGCLSPFKKIDAEDFYKQQVRSCSLVDAVAQLEEEGLNLKVCDVFANFLGIPSEVIGNYKVKDILAAIELKYHAALEDWHQGSPSNTDEFSVVLNRKIQSFKGITTFFSNELTIEILDNEEEKRSLGHH